MINLYEILQQVLTESVNSNAVIDAIANKVQVIITYSDEENRAPQKRVIQPYVYGLTKAGNPCLRAFQSLGDTFRGQPKWKLFRLDRITSWQPTNNHFNATPLASGWKSAQDYNEEGDDTMSEVLYQIHFGGNEHPDTLDAIRTARKRLQNSTPINISQISEPNPSGAITNDKVANKDNYYTNQNQQPVLRGAITTDNIEKKNKDYWKDYTSARKEKTQQNKKPNKSAYNNTYYFKKKADRKPLIKPHDEDNIENIDNNKEKEQNNI